MAEFQKICRTTYKKSCNAGKKARTLQRKPKYNLFYLRNCTYWKPIRRAPVRRLFLYYIDYRNTSNRGPLGRMPSGAYRIRPDGTGSNAAPRCQARAGGKYRAVWPSGRGRKNFCVPTNLLEISAVGRPARVRHHGVASLHWTVYLNSRESHTAERRGPR